MWIDNLFFLKNKLGLYHLHLKLNDISFEAPMKQPNRLVSTFNIYCLEVHPPMNPGKVVPF